MWGWRAAYGAGRGAMGASRRLRCTARPRVAVWGIAAIETCVERPRVVKRKNAAIELVCIERPRVAVWGIAPIKLLRCIQRPRVAKSGIAPIKLVCVC